MERSGCHGFHEGSLTAIDFKRDGELRAVSADGGGCNCQRIASGRRYHSAFAGERIGGNGQGFFLREGLAEVRDGVAQGASGRCRLRGAGQEDTAYAALGAQADAARHR